MNESSPSDPARGTTDSATAPGPDPAADAPEAPVWLADAIAWQVYPLGFCGAPARREDLEAASYGAEGENVVHRLGRITGYLDHLLSLGANVLILNPIFDSVSHGYDTLDHTRLDPRLGDLADVEALFAAAHERGIRVILDGVFNHVSDRHPVVRQALAEGPGTPAGDRIRWAGEHPYGFEGNADLVELNLADASVRDAIVAAMELWLDRGADGWRLDAMYAAGPDAWAPIIARVKASHPEAWILGEVIHGDYPAFAAASGADSLTQYELWKAIWSSLRDGNLYELAHAIGRGEEFRAPAGDAGHVLVPQVFLGNHDTTRIASQLPDGRDLAPAIALLAMLPGVPTIYAGDEVGAAAVKEERAGGDDAIRPAFPDDPEQMADALDVLSDAAGPRILEVHRRLLSLRRRNPWLATARASVDEGSLTNTTARISLRGADDAQEGPDGQNAQSLTLVLNLGEAPVDAGGEVVETVSGADMLDATGPAAPAMVPAHSAAVVRG